MSSEQPTAADAPERMFKNFVQLGVIVRDLDRTVKALSEIFGLGPFRFVTYPPAGRDDIRLAYRGQPGHFSHRIAFADLGPIELEIVEPSMARVGSPSSWSSTGKVSITSASTCPTWNR